MPKDTSRNQLDALLSIGAVVEEVRRDFPDVSHSSLRFLEREGLITAHRTAGGHRLYTEADVERIRQIKIWQSQRLSLDEIRQRLTQVDRLPPPATMAKTFLEQALGGSLGAAYLTIINADDLGLPLVRIFEQILQPALTELGDRWEQGDLLVAQEKEVSELVRDAIGELSFRHAWVDADRPVVVAAGVEGERHDLGLRMLCGLLKSTGFPVHFLGADVAPRFLVEAVVLHRPAIILLSAKLEPNLLSVRLALDALSEVPATSQHPTVFVGGQLVEGHEELIRPWSAIPVSSVHLHLAVSIVESAPTTSPLARSEQTTTKD